MQWKDRARATGLHLLVSLSVATITAALVFIYWFPFPYAQVSGGSEIFRIIVSADVVIGPLLTMIVFDRAKGRAVLKRDLTMIVFLQLTALFYGLWVVYEARPIYLVHEVERFRVVTRSDIDKADLAQAKPQFQTLPVHGVRLIGVRQTKSAEEFLQVLESSLAGKDVSFMPKLWQELDDKNREEIRQRGRSMAFLRGRAKDGGRALDGLAADSRVPPEQIIGLPLMGRRDDWSVIVDRRDTRILGYLPINAF